MACAALKRPYSFDLLALTSPQQKSGISNKRQRCGSTISTGNVEAQVSPFVAATPKVVKDELAANIQQEWQRMHRRRKLITKSSPSTSSISMPGLMNNSKSTECLDGVPSPPTFLPIFPTSQNDCQPTTPVCLSPSQGFQSIYSGSPFSPQSGSSFQSRICKDQPSLSVKQVVTVCERLWKDREDQLRQEYDKVLNDRLSEQYDAFLKFTQDQIMKRYQQTACSYVS